MTNSVQDSAAASEDITRAMSGVDAMVRGAAEGVRQSESAASSLRRLAQDLDAQLSEFQH